MEKNIETLERIEKYLEDTMSPKEKKEFEQQLQDDPELKTTFEEHKELIRTIHLIERQRLIESLHDLNRQLPEIDLQTVELGDSIDIPEGEPKPKPPIWKKYWVKTIVKWGTAIGMAAAIAMLVVFYAIPDPNQRLFDKYFIPDPGIPVQMSDYKTYTKAMLAYQAHNYRQAIEELELLESTIGPRDTIDFLMGNAWLARNKPAEAQQSFQRVLRQASGYTEYAQWYLALAYLLGDKRDDATTMLKAIVTTSNHYYTESATALLQDMKDTD
jgi:hypothetical protein